MKVREKKINLLPKEYIQAEKVKKGLMIAGGILVLEVISFIFLVAMPPKAQRLITDQQLDALSKELDNDRFGEMNLMLQQLETAEADVQEWRVRYDTLKSENVVSTRVLDSLISRVPFNLTINKLTISPEENNTTASAGLIKIEGSSVENIAVLNYTTVIEQVFGRGTIQYEVTYDEALKVYQYTIDVTIPAKEQPVEEVGDETTLEVGLEGGSNE